MNTWRTEIMMIATGSGLIKNFRNWRIVAPMFFLTDSLKLHVNHPNKLCHYVITVILGQLPLKIP